MGKVAWFICFFTVIQFSWSQEIDSLRAFSPVDSIPSKVDAGLSISPKDTIPVEVDSLDIIWALDILPSEVEIDTIIKPELDSLALAKTLDTVSVDTLPVPEMIYIKKSMLDSLLSPYYKITLDSTVQDTIFNFTLTPRYRLKVDRESGDSSYVSLPKNEDHVNAFRTYGLDTLKIPAGIKVVSIDRKKVAEEPEWWEYENKIAFDLNEVAFVNWNAGGDNSVSGLLKVNLSRTYKKVYTKWENEISMRYGLNYRDNEGLIKTDDEIKLSSSFGYNKDTLSHWFYTAQFNFRTQFTDGFSRTDKEDPISRFMAPGYLFLGMGGTYSPEGENLSVYLSPLTMKATYVLDEKLSQDGSFGVTPGEKSRHEVGILVRSKWEKEIIKNVAMANALEFYSDYLNDFGNIDVEWIFDLKFKVNKFFQASFRTHLIYDNDIKFKEDTNGDGQLETLGARAQFKQQLGIGILYSF
jgi:hypothetical protein